MTDLEVYHSKLELHLSHLISTITNMRELMDDVANESTIDLNRNTTAIEFAENVNIEGLNKRIRNLLLSLNIQSRQALDEARQELNDAKFLRSKIIEDNEKAASIHKPHPLLKAI